MTELELMGWYIDLGEASGKRWDYERGMFFETEDIPPEDEPDESNP